MDNTITYEVGAEALQNALKANYDVESAYMQLLEKAKEEAVKDYLMHKINTIDQFSLTIVSVLKQMNIKPLEKGTVLGGILRLWIDLKSTVVEYNPFIILEEIKKIEKDFCYVYIMQIRSGIHSGEVYELLSNQLSEMQSLKCPELHTNIHETIESI